MASSNLEPRTARTTAYRFTACILTLIKDRAGGSGQNALIKRQGNVMTAGNSNVSGNRGQPAAGSERKALSSALVRCITGDLDDQSVVDIISTGASEEQLMRAVMQVPRRQGAGDEAFLPSSPPDR